MCFNIYSEEREDNKKVGSHFPTKYFPSGWDQLCDMHGQVLQVCYPVKIRSFISWSPKKFLGVKAGICKRPLKPILKNYPLNLSKCQVIWSKYNLHNLIPLNIVSYSWLYPWLDDCM